MTPEVALWLLLTGVGVVLSVALIWVGFSDLKFIRENNINHESDAVTRLSLRVEIRRAVINFAFFLVGIHALFVDPSTCTYSPLNTELSLILFATVGVLIWNSAEMFLFRYRYYQLTADDDFDDPGTPSVEGTI